MATQKNKPSLPDQFYKIAGQYHIFECERCIDALIQFLRRHSLEYGVKRAKRIRLETGYDTIYDIKSRITYDGQLIAETGFHVAIEIEDVIYDNLNPRGILKSEWITKFERVIDNTVFNQVVFGSYDTFIVTETDIFIETE
jgi:hypothetical protein